MKFPKNSKSDDEIITETHLKIEKAKGDKDALRRIEELLPSSEIPYACDELFYELAWARGDMPCHEDFDLE